MPVGQIGQVVVNWEPKRNSSMIKRGNVASLVKSFQSLNSEVLEERIAELSPTSTGAGRGSNLRSQQCQTSSASPISRSSRSNPFTRRDSTGSPITSSPVLPLRAPLPDLAIQAPSPQRYVDATKYESQARIDEMAPDSRAGFGRRQTTAFANPAGRRTSRPWALHSPEIEDRRNSRPLVRLACGHLEHTASVPVPGGNDAPGLIDQLDDGTYILVGPKVQSKDRNGNTLTPGSDEVVPIVCVDCLSQIQSPVKSPRHRNTSAQIRPHSSQGDQEYWPDQHSHPRKPRRRVSMGRSVIESEAKQDANSDHLAAWSPPREATPYSSGRLPLTPPNSNIIDVKDSNRPLQSVPKFEVLSHSFAAYILRDIDKILDEHMMRLTTVITNLRDEIPKVGKIKDLSRQLLGTSFQLRETSQDEQKVLPSTPVPQLQHSKVVMEAQKSNGDQERPPSTPAMRTRITVKALPSSGNEERSTSTTASQIQITIDSQPSNERDHAGMASSAPNSPLNIDLAGQPLRESLNDVPRLMRRRTQSVPELLKLIDNTAADLGIDLAKQSSTQDEDLQLPLQAIPIDTTGDIETAKHRIIHEPSTPLMSHAFEYGTPQSSFDVPRTASPSALSTTSSTSRYSQPSVNMPRSAPETPAEPSSEANLPMNHMDNDIADYSSYTLQDAVESETGTHVPRVESSHGTSYLPKNRQNIIDDAYRTLASSYPVSAATRPVPEFKVQIREPTLPVSTITELPSHPTSPPSPQHATSVPIEFDSVNFDIHGSDCPHVPHLHVPGDWEFPLQLYDTPAPPPPTPDERTLSHVGQMWSSGLRTANHHLQELTRRISPELGASNKETRPPSPLSPQFWSSGARNASQYLYRLSHHHSDSSKDVGARGTSHEAPSYLQHDPARRTTPSPMEFRHFQAQNSEIESLPEPIPPLTLNEAQKGRESRLAISTQRSPSPYPAKEGHIRPQSALKRLVPPHEVQVDPKLLRRESAPASSSLGLPPFLRNTPYSHYIAQVSPSASSAGQSSFATSQANELTGAVEKPWPAGERIVTQDWTEKKPSSLRSKRSGDSEHWARVEEQVRNRWRGAGQRCAETSPGEQKVERKSL